MKALKIMLCIALCAVCCSLSAYDIKAGPKVLFSINAPSTEYTAEERAQLIQENIDKILIGAEVPQLRAVPQADKSVILYSGDFKIGMVLKEDAADGNTEKEAAAWLAAIKGAYGVYVNKDLKFVLTSDIHNSHQSWYGLPNDARMRKWVQAITKEQSRGKIDSMFILGDVSLDYWMNGGSYNKGISNTQTFINKYVKALPNAIPWYIIPGNHEQYTPEKWKEITGFDRYYAVNMGNCLFIMLDAFAGELGADYDHDGRYVSHNVSFIKECLAKYPAQNVFLCAHWFHKDKETAEFKQLLADEPRIRCLFNGHAHRNNVDILDEWNKKPVLHTGQWSYYIQGGSDDIYWGYRVLTVSVDGSIVCDYVVPTHNILPDGSHKLVPEKRIDSWTK